MSNDSSLSHYMSVSAIRHLAQHKAP